MNNDDPYVSPPPMPQSAIEPRKIGVWLVIGAVLAVGFNTLVYILKSLAEIGGLGEVARSPGNTGEFLGFILGGVVILPLIIVALFFIGKSFRNARSILKIFTVTSLVLGLLGIFQVLAEIGSTITP